MKKNTIITIGRQFGSGGHEIAQGIAERLSIPFYDKEIIVEAAKKSGLHENLFKDAEERSVSSFLYAIAMGTYAPMNGLNDMPVMNMNETIFQVQSKVITDFAARGSCVFVGRCADYILRERERSCRVFVYADFKTRIKRIEKLYQLSQSEAENLITKTDKKRGSFYHFYTGRDWHDLQNYDMCINSGQLGVDGAVEMILSYVEKMK